MRRYGDLLAQAFISKLGMTFAICVWHCLYDSFSYSTIMNRRPMIKLRQFGYIRSPYTF